MPMTFYGICSPSCRIVAGSVFLSSFFLSTWYCFTLPFTFSSCFITCHTFITALWVYSTCTSSCMYWHWFFLFFLFHRLNIKYIKFPVFPLVIDIRKEGLYFISCFKEKNWSCCRVKKIYYTCPKWNLIQNKLHLLLFSWFAPNWCFTVFLNVYIFYSSWRAEVRKYGRRCEFYHEIHERLYDNLIIPVCGSVMSTNYRRLLLRTVKLVIAGHKHEIWKYITAKLITPNMWHMQSSQTK